MFSDDHVSQILKEQYNLQALKIEDLHGHIDQILKVHTKTSDYVLKISCNPRMTKRMLESQLAYITFLNKRDFCTPKIIESINEDSIITICDGKDHHAILFEFISNSKPIEVIDELTAKEFGHWFGSLHAASAKYEGESLFYYEPLQEEKTKLNDIGKYIFESHKSFLRELFELKKEYIKKYQLLLRRCRTASLMNDINNTNVHVYNNSYIVLDWNICGKNYFVDDLSWVLAWVFIGSGKLELIKPFMEEYLKVFPLQKSERDVVTFLPINYSYLMWKNFENFADPSNVASCLKTIKKVTNTLLNIFL